MTFAELLAEVYLITGRPDQEGMSKSAIQRATLKVHGTDLYDKDIYEESIEFDTSAYIHALDIYTLIPNFRAWKYVKRVDGTTDSLTGALLSTPIQLLDVDQVLDSYGAMKSDIAYVAGRNLEIKASVPFTKAIIGCYVHPIITEAEYSSWIAIQYPWVIIHEACRLIFRAIGKLDEANAQGQMAAEELNILRIGSIPNK